MARSSALNAYQQQMYNYAANRAAQMGFPDPQAFARQIHQESSFNPHAVSPAGAQGIAQFMPATAHQVGLDNPWDPYASIDAALRYHQMNARTLSSAGIDPSIANLMAAYNAGPKAVIQHGGVPNYAETKGYVGNITQQPSPLGQSYSPGMVSSAMTNDAPFETTTTTYKPVSSYTPAKAPTVDTSTPRSLSAFSQGLWGQVLGSAYGDSRA